MIRTFAYLALVFVVLVFAVQTADYVRFSKMKPVEAQACNYQGRWESDKHPVLQGRILAELPSPLPKGVPFPVKAFVYYHSVSLYQAGRFVPMEMEGLVDDAGGAAGGGAPDRAAAAAAAKVTFKFKGGDEFAQTIDYVSTASDDFSQISGGYKTSSSDVGTFSLRKMR